MISTDLRHCLSQIRNVFLVEIKTAICRIPVSLCLPILCTIATVNDYWLSDLINTT